MKFRKAEVVLAEKKVRRNHRQKEENKNCLRLCIRGKECILNFSRKVVPLKSCFIKGTAEEKLAKSYDILKLVVAAHEDCKSYLKEEKIENSDEWLE